MTIRALISPLTLFALLGPAAAFAQEWRFADVDGHRLAYQCRGSGAPVIVLIPPSGIASTEAFAPVLPALAARRKVCLYERLGFEPSAAPEPGLVQTARDYARELQAVLALAAPGEPQLLIGYSYGGFVARVHAAEHSEAVKGLLLIDAAQEDWLSGLKARMSEADWARMQGILDWFKRRLAHDVWSSQDEVRTTRLRSDLPVRLLSRGLPYQRIRQAQLSEEGVELYNRLHDEGQLKMLTLSGQTTRSVAGRSEHLIVESEPERVLQELDALLAE